MSAGMARPGCFVETSGYYYFVVSLCPTLREALPSGRVPVIRVGHDKVIFFESDKIVRVLPASEILRLKWARGVPVTDAIE
jgi:hypothetical protein